MSFRKYIAKQKATDDPFGDFIMDGKRDKSLPDAKSWTQLWNYLTSKCGGDRNIEDAARSVWDAYEASLQKK